MDRSSSLAPFAFILQHTVEGFEPSCFFTRQEITPEIGLVVGVAGKPPHRYEIKWEKQRKSLSTTRYPPQTCFSSIYKNLSAASGYQRRSASRAAQSGGTKTKWKRVSIFFGGDTCQMIGLFLSVMHLLVFRFSVIAVNQLGFCCPFSGN